VDLGAGRRTKEDTVDPTAGIVFERTVGDKVEPGDVIARLYARDASRIPAAQEAVADAFTAGAAAPESTSAIIDRYTRDGWSNGADAASSV